MLALLGGLGLASSRPAHTAGGPVPVTVANAPLAVTATDGIPVETYLAVTPQTGSSGVLVYTVPAGKKLVVESMTLFGGGGGTIYTGVVHNVDSAGNAVSFASLTTGVSSNDVATTTQPMRLHVGPGGQVLIDVYERGGSGGLYAYVSLSGSLVPAP